MGASMGTGIPPSQNSGKKPEFETNWDKRPVMWVKPAIPRMRYLSLKQIELLLRIYSMKEEYITPTGERIYGVRLYGKSGFTNTLRRDKRFGRYIYSKIKKLYNRGLVDIKVAINPDTNRAVKVLTLTPLGYKVLEIFTPEKEPQ